MILYNDNEPFVCDWLRNLIDAGHLPQGEVVDTPIQELKPDSIPATFHTFAGIGGWPLALRMAGWPDDQPVWTGSCPCQPFSSAGKRKGTDDERHLWPAFRDLIAECRPPVVFGEQVASKAGREWLAGVRADLEALGYAVGSADLCAAGVGAPHIRQRLYWVADSTGERFDGIEDAAEQGWRHGIEDDGGMRDGLGNTSRNQALAAEQRQQQLCDACCERYRMGDSDVLRRSRIGGAWQEGAAESGIVRCIEPTKHGGTVTKYRRAPLEPSLFPLADGVPGRVGLLRGAGNAIVPQVAAAFVRAYMETLGGRLSEMKEVAG